MLVEYFQKPSLQDPAMHFDLDQTMHTLHYNQIQYHPVAMNTFQQAH